MKGDEGRYTKIAKSDLKERRLCDESDIAAFRPVCRHPTMVKNRAMALDGFIFIDQRVQPGCHHHHRQQREEEQQRRVS